MAELSEEYKEIPKHQVLDKLKYKLKSFPLNTKHEYDLGFPSLDNPSHWISDDNEGKKIRIKEGVFKKSIASLYITQLITHTDSKMSFKE